MGCLLLNEILATTIGGRMFYHFATTVGSGYVVAISKKKSFNKN
jgi:hypothetical protein